MGCAPSKSRSGRRLRETSSAPVCQECDRPVFRGGLAIPNHRKCAYAGVLDRMDALRLPYLTHRSLLSGFQANGTWDIHIHISDWPVPVTKACIDKLLSQFRKSVRGWLSGLKGYDGFTRKDVKVRLFGVVLCGDVATDASFDASKYGNGTYPLVRRFVEAGERCPWTLAGNRTPVSSNWYHPDLDLHTVRATGNRTDLRGVTTCVPASWDGFVHPEGCTGFQTRLWIGMKEYKAFAQRHYVRLSKVFSDPKSGDLGGNVLILQHEIGHCFFLDDLYDAGKYPPKPAKCVCVHGEDACRVLTEESIMKGGPKIAAFDHAQLRHGWANRRKDVS